MAILLRNLAWINQSTQQEHASWLESNVPSTLSLAKIQLQQYSILNYPDLWSGARFFETQIEVQGEKDDSAYEIIQELINDAKKEHQADSKLKEEIKNFAKKYQKYFNFLIQRSLLQAINQTINDINRADETKAFREVLNASSLLAMQTRFACLEAHKQISMLVNALKNGTNPKDIQEIEKIKQLEVLSKRLLDCHYEGAKKRTLKEIFSEGLSTITSFIGLFTGIPAALCALGGIFFPPLLVPAGILGLVSFISYVSSAVSAVKMMHESMQYGRSPSPSDVKWLVIDAALVPFNLFGGQIFAVITHTLKPIQPLKFIVKQIGFIWNEIISNVLPDAVETKEVVSDMYHIGSVLTKEGELKNTTTATSFQKIRGALAEHDPQAISKISHTKEKINQMPSKTALYGRNFAFIKYTKEQSGSFPVTESYHGHILLWDTGFWGTRTSKEAQKILNAVNDYKELKSDASIQERITALEYIVQYCECYLTVYKHDETKGRLRYVANLLQNTKKEWDNLYQLTAADKEEPVVLVGFKV